VIIIKEIDHPWTKVSYNVKEIILEFDSLEAEKRVEGFSWESITRNCNESCDQGIYNLVR